MPIYTLYHGNTEKVVDNIVAAGSCLPAYKSTGPNHYLGDGYYFYDDPVQARVWAIMKVKRNDKYRGQNWAVLKCEVEIEEEYIFDLDKRNEQDFFFSEMIKLHLQIQSGDLEVDHYRDTYLCNHLSSILGIELFTKTFPYIDKSEIVTPIFSNIRPTEFPITRHFRTEKQYCLRTEKINSPYKIECGTMVKRGDSRNG